MDEKEIKTPQKETILALLEEWAEELDITNIIWHELTLLKSFGYWLEQKASEQNDKLLDRYCPDHPDTELVIYCPVEECKRIF